MNNNETRTLWISLGAGLFAAFLLYSYSQEKKAEYDKSYGTMTNVVIAKADISELQTLDDTLIEIAQKPANYVEPGAVVDPESIIGHIAAAPIKKGEQILANKLLQPGPETGISLQISPTKRALTLPVDEVRGVAKLIRPGDRVDIVTAIDSGKGMNARREVVTMLTDVPVLATGVSVVNNIPRTFDMDSNSKNIVQTSLIGDTKYSSITLEVSPREAQDLIYILSTAPGNIFFTLRNPNDKQNMQRMPSATSDTILGRPAVVEAPITSPASGNPLLPRPAQTQPPPRRTY
ncbi:MAG: Flp pilus assembly protein CpaB [Bdellovibrionaceae bacterium]|nr:Flp pilus assembly protein CpaB [Pseudobdellovibrionaceae bacterium]